MRNVTISMDEALFARVRVESAKADRSVSRWVARELARGLADADRKTAASDRIERLLEQIDALDLPPGEPVKFDREEIYDERLRRFDDLALSTSADGEDQGRSVPQVAEISATYESSGDESSGSQ